MLPGSRQCRIHCPFLPPLLLHPTHPPSVRGSLGEHGPDHAILLSVLIHTHFIQSGAGDREGRHSSRQLSTCHTCPRGYFWQPTYFLSDVNTLSNITFQAANAPVGIHPSFPSPIPSNVLPLSCGTAVRQLHHSQPGMTPTSAAPPGPPQHPHWPVSPPLSLHTTHSST